jgi:hypothetical protein
MSKDLRTPIADAWPMAPAWTLDDTERFLTGQALPSSFQWPHRDKAADGAEILAPVMPSYRLHKGYGFWLRTTPYFPGLFEEIHAVLLRWPDDSPMPDAEQLAEILNQRRAARGKQAEIKL